MILTATQRRTGWIVLLITFVALRLLLPVVLKPVGYIADWNDYYFFEGWARFTDRGLYPYLHFWMEHPPLFPWFVVAAYRLSAAIPAWHDPHFAFALVFGSMLLVFELGNLVLVGRIAGRLWGSTGGLTAAWFYALLFAPVFYWSAGFECYPLFFLLLAAERGLAAIDARGRRALAQAALAGLAAGIGIMVKIIPGLALPAVAFALWRTGKRTAAGVLILVTVVTSVAIAAPFAIANPTMARASATSLVTRSGWETVWALLDGYYSGGTVAKPETRLDPATAGITEREAKAPMLPVLAVAGALGLVALWRARNWQRPQTLVAALGLTLALFFLANKGYSPQFLVYLLVVPVVLWPNRKGLGYALLLSAVNLAEYPLALLLFADQPGVLIVTVLLRTALLVVLALEYLAVLLDLRLSPALSRARWAGAAGVMALLLATTGAATVSYASAQAAGDPQSAAAQVIRDDPGPVLFTDPSLYDRMTPLLRGAAETRLVVADRPARIPVGATLWNVSTTSEEAKDLRPRLASRLAVDYYQVDIRTEAGVQLTRYLAANPPSRPATGTLGGITLAGAAAATEARAGTNLPVGLTWNVVTPPNADLAVFVQLTDSHNILVAQHDGAPASGARPSTGWQAGDEIIDHHVIPLPRDLASGEYRLIAGLYDRATGKRLTGPAGDYLAIGELKVTP